MLKNKMFLQGLGIGLIVGAVLLQLMFTASQTDDNQDSTPSVPKKLNREQLVASARELGFQLVSKDQTVYTEQQYEAAVKKAGEQNNNEQTKSGFVQQPAQQSFAFVIPRKTGSSEVAALLLELGIIQDQTAFQNELDKRKLSGKIQAGTYKFIGTPKLNDLIQKITSPPQ